MTGIDGANANTERRCVGSLDRRPVYFSGTRTSFHLLVEYLPGKFRRLTDAEHLRFRHQSRVDGISYGQYWE